MNLPKIDQPLYEVNLLSINKPVKFRPFLVKEQKIMMMAVEGKDIDSTMRAIKQIIANCVVDPINIDELPLVDLETLFLNLRARSMGEMLNLYFKCINDIPGEKDSSILVKCNMPIEVQVDILKDIKVVGNKFPDKIMLSDDVGVKLKYPSLSMVNDLIESNDNQVIFTVIANCLELIFDKENVYKAKDASTEELVSFVEQLPTDKFDILANYINDIPKARYETKKKCPKCGYEHDFVLEGISDFFI